MRKLLAALLMLAGTAQAQPASTLVVLRSIDADKYDPAKSTARSAGEVFYMLADTLTSIDWDMKTVKPGLASSWTVSEDGKLYTFTIRDDVTFCDGRKFDPAAARKLLDENGWVPGPDGVRVKDGVRASFLLYGIIDAQWNRASEAIQADLKRIGVEMRIQLFDATVAWGKLATQEFGAFVMSYPYVSASDALSLYFASANTPTPNRMNWRNADTDKWLVEGRTALDPAVKHAALANVQRQVTEANVWVPLVREQLWVASAKRVEGARAHGIYGVGVYKGLDITVGK